MPIENLLNLTIDYVFKRVVGREESEKIANNFIFFALNEKIENINITRWKIQEEKYGKHVLTDLLEICIIELPKAQRYNENKDLDTWVKFIKNPEVINMASEETTEAINAAKKLLEEMSQDEHERYLAELRQKYIMDQKAIADRGLEKGLEKGIEKGIERGIEQVAKNMLKKGVEIDFIMEVTNLSKEKIESLKDCE